MEKNNKVIVVLLIVLIIGLIGSNCYMIYDRYLKKEPTTNDNIKENEEVNVPKKEENQEKENDEIGDGIQKEKEVFEGTIFSDIKQSNFIKMEIVLCDMDLNSMCNQNKTITITEWDKLQELFKLLAKQKYEAFEIDGIGWDEYDVRIYANIDGETKYSAIQPLLIYGNSGTYKVDENIELSNQIKNTIINLYNNN